MLCIYCHNPFPSVPPCGQRSPPCRPAASVCGIRRIAHCISFPPNPWGRSHSPPPRSPHRSRPLPHHETRRAHAGSHELRPGPRPGGETMASTVLECSAPKAVPRHRTDPKGHPSPGGRVQADHCLFWWHKRPAPAPAPTAGGGTCSSSAPPPTRSQDSRRGEAWPRRH